MTAKELENGANFSLINNDATRNAIIATLAKDEHLSFNPDSDFYVFYDTIKEFVNETPLSEILTMPMPDLYVAILAKAIEGRIYDYLCGSYALDKDGKTMDERNIALGLAKEYIYLGVDCPTYITDDDISTFVEQTGGRIIWGDDEDEQDGDEQEKHAYKVKLSISYHKDYTVSSLSRRIIRRLHYQWPNNTIITHIEKESGVKNFTGTVTIYTEESDLKAVTDKIFFRLGATSGKPWKRCHVLGIERKG